MANRSPFTREELVLCIYAAIYDIADIGGLDAIHMMKSRSRSSIRMKIQNLVSMCDEQGVPRFSDEHPLTGLPAGETGRRTNWDLVSEYSRVSRSEHLQECNRILRDQYSLPGELTKVETFFEGATRQVLVNKYERDPAARRKCIEHFGPVCVVCGFDFGNAFGPTMLGFIHVHHLIPLAEIGVAYEVNPIIDLRPVCPNCHAAIHYGGITRTIAAVRSLFQSAH